jgi:hypothetical protein
MIHLITGDNAITFPLQDFPGPIPATLVCRVVNSSTHVEYWCLLEDDNTLIDWIHLPIEVVAVGADPAQSQIALGITPISPSDFDLYIYAGAAYVENPNLLTLIIKERMRYGL